MPKEHRTKGKNRVVEVKCGRCYISPLAVKYNVGHVPKRYCCHCYCFSILSVIVVAVVTPTASGVVFSLQLWFLSLLHNSEVSHAILAGEQRMPRIYVDRRATAHTKPSTAARSNTSCIINQRALDTDIIYVWH